MNSDKRFFKTLLLAAFIVGGIWVLMNKDRIKKPSDVVNLAYDQFGNPIQGTPENPSQIWPQQSPFASAKYQRQSTQRPRVNRQPQFVTNVIRIGSFKLKPNTTGSGMDLNSLQRVAEICRRYDAIALQDINGADVNWLRRLVDQMNLIGYTGSSVVDQPKSSNRPNYAFFSDLGRNGAGETQSAIVFNRTTLTLDESQWYTINDPDNILSRKPIVGWFRAAGPPPEQAFTFTLANLELHPNRPERELSHLGDLFRAIRYDGRGEDDVLIVGDFNAGDSGFEGIGKQLGMTWVVSNRPTTTRNEMQRDNLIFNEVATAEFTGRGGVFDFLRHYNLSLEEAVALSEHLPVWAEFSIFEGKANATHNLQPSVSPALIPKRASSGPNDDLKF